MQHEGEDVARWLNAHGVAGFVLKYRLGPVYHHPIELGDAQRALRLVRLNAKEYGIAPDHLGMWGFSAERASARRPLELTSTLVSLRHPILSNASPAVLTF